MLPTYFDIFILKAVIITILYCFGKFLLKLSANWTIHLLSAFCSAYRNNWRYTKWEREFFICKWKCATANKNKNDIYNHCTLWTRSNLVSWSKVFLCSHKAKKINKCKYKCKPANMIHCKLFIFFVAPNKTIVFFTLKQKKHVLSANNQQQNNISLKCSLHIM